MQAVNDIAFDINPTDLLRIQLCIHDIVTGIIEGNEYQCQRDINSFSNYAKILWMWCGMRRHHMETFSALLALCAGNSPVTGEFPTQRPVTRSFAVFFDLRLDQQLRKRWKRLWFEAPSRSLWRHCNGVLSFIEHPLPLSCNRCLIISLYAMTRQPVNFCDKIKSSKHDAHRNGKT